MCGVVGGSLTQRRRGERVELWEIVAKNSHVVFSSTSSGQN